MSCSTITSVSAGARRRRSRAVCLVSSGDMPAVGSSRSRSSGSATRAMAISSRRLSPWASVPASWPAHSARCTWSSTASTRRSTSSLVALGRATGEPELRARPQAMSATFSRTVSLGKTCEIWNERTMPRRKTAGEARPVMSHPLNMIIPVVGTRAPVIRLNSVVLPAPFGPMIERTSPCSMLRLTRFTAARPPKRRVSSHVWRSVIRAASGTSAPPLGPHRRFTAGLAARHQEPIRVRYLLDNRRVVAVLVVFLALDHEDGAGDVVVALTHSELAEQGVLEHEPLERLHDGAALCAPSLLDGQRDHSAPVGAARRRRTGPAPVLRLAGRGDRGLPGPLGVLVEVRLARRHPQHGVARRVGVHLRPEVVMDVRLDAHLVYLLQHAGVARTEDHDPDDVRLGRHRLRDVRGMVRRPERRVLLADDLEG